MAPWSRGLRYGTLNLYTMGDGGSSIPMGEKFLTSVRDRCQPTMKILGSCLKVTVIPVYKSKVKSSQPSLCETYDNGRLSRVSSRL